MLPPPIPCPSELTFSGDEDDAVLNQGLAWADAGRGVVLATVVESNGSVPRPPGSQLVIDDRGNFAGSVSGGCIEGAIIAEAQILLKGGPARRLNFSGGGDPVWGIGLACGGGLTVALQRGEPRLLADLCGRRAEGRPAGLILDTGRGTAWLVDENDPDFHPLLAAGRSLPLSDDLFLRAYNPGWRLVLIGAVHIAQLLAPLAARAGFSVSIVDPRSAFLSEERFPGIERISSWPDAALAARPPTARTAVVALTHDPKIDDKALALALDAPCFYVGVLGGAHSRSERLDRLAALGVAPADLERLHGPVGLDLGGKAPMEIAVSILAALIAARHGRPHMRAA